MTIGKRRLGLGLALSLVAFATLPGPAWAQGGRTEAEQALQKVKDLKHGIGVHTGRELTPALAELNARRNALDATGRKEAASLLARPTDAMEGLPGHAYATTEATPACSAHFCMHYVTTSVDAPPLTDANPANGVPDYVDSMLSVFEDEVFACENGAVLDPNACAGASANLGWPQAPSDGTRGGDSKFDVYIEQLGTSGVFGYAAPEQNAQSSFSYMVMDDDYAEAEYGYADPLLPMRVTAAHEYNHVLQFGIDAIEDIWMFEATATWAEDKVYPAINDYLGYVDQWVLLTAQPITEFATDKNNTPAREDLKVYGSAVWNHFLSGRYGDDTILHAWQAKTEDPGGNGSLAPASYSTALAGDASSFATEFEDFSAAVAEWSQPNAVFPDIYPDVPASLRPDMTLNAAGTTIQLDHTTFAFRNIAPPATPVPLTITATLPAGLDGAVALVGRTTGGVVTPAITHTMSGGTITATLPADNYARITAVLVNADTSTSGFSSSDWNWTADNKNFTGVRVSDGAPPPPPTANTEGATGVTTSGATLNGTVDPQGQTTTYHFEYGTTTGYGSQTPEASAGGGTGAVPVAAAVSGLAAATTYHYRLVVQGPNGQVGGADQAFTTAAPASQPPPPLATTGSGTTTTTTTGTNTGVTPRKALTVSLAVFSAKLRAVLAKGLRVRTGCGETCSVTVKLTLGAKDAKRLHVKRTIATVRRRAGTAKLSLRLRVSRKVARALARLEKVRITVTTTAVSGTRKASVSKSVTLRR
jgi:hypothetical protein